MTSIEEELGEASPPPPQGVAISNADLAEMVARRILWKQRLLMLGFRSEQAQVMASGPLLLDFLLRTAGRPGSPLHADLQKVLSTCELVPEPPAPAAHRRDCAHGVRLYLVLQGGCEKCRKETRKSALEQSVRDWWQTHPEHALRAPE